VPDGLNNEQAALPSKASARRSPAHGRGSRHRRRGQRPREGRTEEGPEGNQATERTRTVNGPWMARATIRVTPERRILVGAPALTRVSFVERVKGIEPSLSAWELARDHASKLGDLVQRLVAGATPCPGHTAIPGE
jgi:hypothetical protein